MQPFLHFSLVFSLYITLYNRRSMSSYFLVFHTSGDILSWTVAFFTFNFFRYLHQVLLPWTIKFDIELVVIKVFFRVVNDFRRNLQADSWNVLSSSNVFLLGWQLLVLLTRCFFFRLLHLLSANYDCPST